MKRHLLFACCLSLLPNVVTANDYDEAYFQYIAEANEYIDTLKTTQTEIRRWRSLYLSERFDGRLQRLEKSLVQSNTQIISEVEKAIMEGGIEGLDDVLLMRMSQLQFEKENLSLNNKMKQYEAQLKAFLSGRLDKAPQLPSPNFKASIDYSRALLTRYPRSPLSDKAHYLMAYGLEEMGEYDAATEVYKRFIRRHPFSPLADEVKWRLAEHYYDVQDFNRAAFYYTDLSKRKGSQFQLKALYKLGATYFAGKKYDLAALYFSDLYSITRSTLDKDRENETLYDEALEYLGIIRTYGVKVKLDNEAISEAMSRLAKAYQRLPNERRARKIYLDYMKEEPYSARVPKFANEVILSHQAMSEEVDAGKMRDSIVSFLTNSNKWWISNRENRTAQFEAEDFLEQYLLDSAQSHASKGFERKNTTELKLARDQYQKFLVTYPYSQLAMRAKFEMAQVEYALGLYPAAQKSYMEVLKSSSTGEFRDEAAYGFLLSNIRRIKYQMEGELKIQIKRGANGEVLPPQEPEDKDKVFLAAADIYLNNGTDIARRQNISYKIAETHYSYNNFDKAETELDKIINDTDNVSITTAKALRLSAEISNIKGDWQAVAQKNNQLMSLSFNSEAGNSSSIQSVQAGTQSLDTAARLEKSGRKLEAAEEYERVAAGLPNSKFAPLASWRAANLYREEGKYKESNANLANLKGTDYEEELLFLQAANLKSQLSFQKSSELFESFSKKYPQNPLTPEALFAAASLRRDLKQYKEAADLFMRYYAYQKIETVVLEASHLYVKSGSTNRALQVLGQLPKGERESQLRMLMAKAEAYWSKKDAKNVINQCKEGIGLIKKQKWMSAQVVRFNSLCRFYDAAFSLSSGSEKAISVLAVLKEAKQADLEARLAVLVAKQYLVQSKINEANDILLRTWSSLNNSPYTIEGREIYNLLRENKAKLPLHLGLVVNWKLPDGYMLNWLTPSSQQLSWGNARSLCEREFYSECITEIDKLLQQEPSEELLNNKLLAQLRSGNDEGARETAKLLGERTNWSQVVQKQLVISGFADLIPFQSLEITVPEQGRAESLVARAVLSMTNKRYKQALEDLQSAIQEDSTYIGSYVILSRLLHETEHWELVKETLNQGLKNTKSQSGLLPLATQFEFTLSRTRSQKAATADNVEAQMHFVNGLIYALQKDKKSYDATVSLVKNKGAWGSLLEATGSLLNQEKSSSGFGQIEKSNGFGALLSAVNSSSQTTALDGLARAKKLGLFSSKFLNEYEEYIKK